MTEPQRIRLTLDPGLVLERLILKRLAGVSRQRGQDWLRSLLVQGFLTEGRWLRTERAQTREGRAAGGSEIPATPFARWLEGKVLSAHTRRSNNRATALLRLAAVNVGKTDSALGAFYRRLAARVGKSKAVTATARKLAILFYNTLRYGMDYSDPGASYYEARHRERVLHNLARRAKQFGYTLEPATVAGVS